MMIHHHLKKHLVEYNPYSELSIVPEKVEGIGRVQKTIRNTYTKYGKGI